MTIDGDPPLRAGRWAAARGARVARRHVEPAIVTAGCRSPSPAARARRHVALRGDVSSQFVTALMLIGPLLDGGLRSS